MSDFLGLSIKRGGQILELIHQYNHEMSSVIDQRKNYAADFGHIFRSSAIFFIPKDVATTINVSNYWNFKNGNQVGLLFSIRDVNGTVVERRQRYFDDGLVINEKNFPVDEGSIEIEAFGNKNLRIPYAAVMAIYESETSVSMVHSYSRNHSLVELEDSHALTTGREGCWTVRSDPTVQHFGVFHNGHLTVEPQRAKLFVTDIDGQDKIINFEIPEIKPFATLKFHLESLYPGLRNWLKGEDGWATVHFENKSAFTRLLLIWRRPETNELQVTHSNFDYSAQKTNLIEGSKPAYMKWPSILNDQVMSSRVVVYPNLTPGIYNLSSAKRSEVFSTGKFLTINDDKTFEFTYEKNVIPSRIVTAFGGALNDSALPFECSMGIYHEKRPPKRFHWLSVSARLNTIIYLSKFTEIYQVPDEILMVFRLYSEKSQEYVEKKFLISSISSVKESYALEKLFPNSGEFLGDSFGYVSLFSNFGGYLMYSSIEKDGSISIEHSF